LGALTTEVANLYTDGHLDAGTTVTWKVYFALTVVNLTVTTTGPGTGTVTSPDGYIHLWFARNRVRRKYRVRPTRHADGHARRRSDVHRLDRCV
jgi:hypothetical protein